MGKTKYKPGQKTPKSGQYGVINKNGKPKEREITSTQGKPLPPTQKSGDTYVLNDKTKHKDDK